MLDRKQSASSVRLRRQPSAKQKRSLVGRWAITLRGARPQAVFA